MRENSATVPTRSQLLTAAVSRHPAGSHGDEHRGCCPVCGGTGWVRAVVELPLEVRCPLCTDGQVG